MDIAPIVAVTYALVGLESFVPAPKKPAAPPAEAKVLARETDQYVDEQNLASAAF